MRQRIPHAEVPRESMRSAAPQRYLRYHCRTSRFVAVGHADADDRFVLGVMNTQTRVDGYSISISEATRAAEDRLTWPLA